MEMQAADRGFKELLLQSAEGRERMLRFRAHIRPLVAELVRRARDAGELRADVVEDDVLLVSLMTGAVAEFTNDVEPELWRRSLALLLDGLRATGASPLPVGPLERRAGRPRYGLLATREALNMSRCTHLDQVEILRGPGDHRRLRGMPRRGHPVGAPAHVPDLRPHRLLRQLARAPRDAPQRQDRPSDHPLRGAQRGLELLLRGRSDVHSALVVTGTPRWTSPRPSTSTV